MQQERLSVNGIGRLGVECSGIKARLYPMGKLNNNNAQNVTLFGTTNVLKINETGLKKKRLVAV